MLRYSLLLAAMTAACTATAGDCPADAVPIQIITGVRPDGDMIITRKDGSVLNLSALNRNDAVIALSAFKGSNPHFSYFVKTVTQHVANRLGKDNLCTDNPDSTGRSLLQFVNWSLSIRGEKPLVSVPSLDRALSGSCRITSPWIDIAVGRSPVPWVRGVVRWNQRQLLADQAVLAGARNVPPGVAMPLKDREFDHFALEYANSEIMREREPVVTPIEAYVPAELMWLFRRAWQSTRGPFISSTLYSLESAMKKGSESYTALTIALIDRCFASDGVDIHYNSILDAADLIPLEQYKIDVLLH